MANARTQKVDSTGAAPQVGGPVKEFTAPTPKRFFARAQGLGAPRMVDGLHGLWVADFPEVISEYTAMGVTLATKGDGTCQDEHMYGLKDGKFLKRGDALVGYITNEEYAQAMAELTALNADVLDGVKVNNQTLPVEVSATPN